MTLSPACIPIRPSVTSGATYPGVQPRVVERRARQHDQLHPGRRVEQRSLQQRAQPDAEPGRAAGIHVQTNSFSAQYGRNAGAIVNAVTRSGTNQFRGLAFGYLRDSSMNATNFFTPGVDDGLKRKQYGGTFGGPIMKNRTFFFGSYQGTNCRSQRRGDRTHAGADRGAARRRLLRLLTRQLRNPLTGQPFPGNRSRRPLFSPVVAPDPLQYLPLPNPDAGDPANLLRYRGAGEPDDHQYLARVDHTLQRQPPHLRPLLDVAAPRRRPYLDAGQRAHQRVRPHLGEHNLLGERHMRSSRGSLNNNVVTFNRTNNDNFQILRRTTGRSASPTSTTTRRRSGSSTSAASSASTPATPTRSTATRYQFVNTRALDARAATSSPSASTTATARATSSTTSAPTAATRSTARRRSPATRWPTSCSASSSPSSRASANTRTRACTSSRRSSRTRGASTRS